MKFFQTLLSHGAIDMNLRIMSKNNSITINVMPGSHNSLTKPLTFTGTAEELDAEFFNSVFPAVEEVRGLESNVSKVKEELQEEATAKPAKKDEAAKPDKKAKPVKKVAPNVKDAEEVESSPLFAGDDAE